jgi:O-antigen ligase
VALALHAGWTYGEAGGVVAEGVRRLRGVYGSPNNLALMLGRVVPVLLALALWGTSRRRRWAYRVAAVPILVALFMTFSSGAWLLGVPAALVALGAGRGRRALAGALAAIGAAALALLPFLSTERVARLLNVGGAETLERRTQVWRAALAMIRDHPWLGVGLDNFLYEYRGGYVLPGAEVERNLSHPHNLVLDYWTRLGVLGVVGLVAGQVAFFRAALRLMRRFGPPRSRAAGTREGRAADLYVLVLGLTASMVDCLAHGLIDNSFFLVDLAFVYMLTVGVVRNLERDAA